MVIQPLDIKNHNLDLRGKEQQDNRVLSKPSNDFCLYKLMKQKAKRKESMINYAGRLRKYADKCDFRDWTADKMIKCMVFSSMKDEELRLSLMDMDLRLDEVLDKVHGKGHYRRYVDTPVMMESLKILGFDIGYHITGLGMAKYKNEDPFVSRIIATKE